MYYTIKEADARQIAREGSIWHVIKGRNGGRETKDMFVAQDLSTCSTCTVCILKVFAAVGTTFTISKCIRDGDRGDGEK